MDVRTPFLGLSSGIGLVIANMVGAGVFLSAGFLAQDLDPILILKAWLVGAALALCGATGYAALAVRLPRSGGEYRLLSDLLHPAVGYLAGWGSLLVGFAAPIAVDAIAVGSFLGTMWASAPRPEITGTLLVVVLTGLHGLHLGLSRVSQDLLVAIKVVGVVVFVALGLALGSRGLPSWTPPNAHPSPLGPFLTSQFWIAFAFSGWNAAIYVASEFRDPRRDVPRAMVIGTLVVSVLYLLVNFVLLANLGHDQLSVVLSSDTQKITLGHLVAEKLLGPTGGLVMSGFAILVLTSSMSAMTLVGPRVYAAMAEDGFLPRVLAGKPAPFGSVVLQGAIAIVLLNTHTILQMVQSISSVLIFFTGLCMITVLRLGFGADPPSIPTRIAAAVYALTAGWILFVGLHRSPYALGWVLLVVVLGLGAYFASKLRLGR